MRRSIFHLLLLFQTVSASTFYEVQGYLSSYTSNSLANDDVEEYIQQNITPQLPNILITVTLIRDIPDNPTVNFVAEVECEKNLQRNDVIAGFHATETIHLITVTELEKSSASLRRRASSLSDADGCQNDGFRLPNGMCDCKPFTSGNNCQNVHCQSWSVLTQDESHCHCPPGFSSQYCEQTGARPPVNADFDLKHRTFVVILSMNPSYWSTKQIVADNLESTISSLQANEPGYIDSYVGLLVLGTDSDSVALGDIQSNNMTEVVQFLRQSNISSPAHFDGPQPILYSLNYALSKNSLMRSHPIVLVFANREDTSTFAPTNSMDDQFQETKLHQSMLAWQAKIYFFISTDPHYNLDTTSNGYEAYRRIASGSHGDLIAHEPAELPYLMQSFVPRLYKPEMISVLSYVPVSMVSMGVAKDFSNQTVTVIVSIDRDQVSDTTSSVQLQLTNGHGAVLNPDVNGKFVKVFTLPDSWSSISLTASAKVTVSVRMFVSSDATFVFSYSPSQQIDSGLPNNIAEYGNYIHARPIGIPNLYGLYEQYLAINAQTSKYEANYGLLRQGYFNMNYEFPKVRLCDPGTYTQKFVAQIYTNPYMTRLYPGMCFKAVHHPNLAQSKSVAISEIGDQDNGVYCNQKNTDALADTNLRDFRQIMFAVEISSPMVSSLSNLMNMIVTLVTRLDNENPNRQYTLLMFDANNAYAAVSTAYTDQFFNSVFAEMTNAQNATGTTSKTRSLDAIFLASQLILLSPAQLNIFATAQPAGGNHNWILPRNMQVNWYYISPSMAIPPYSNMKLMEKQTGGRTVVTTPAQVGNLFTVIQNSVYDNNLVYDNGFQDCTRGVAFPFFMDLSFERVTLTLTGQNIRLVSLLDGTNRTIDTRTGVVFSNNASLVIDIVNQGNLFGGTWTAYLTTTYGQCFFQARIVSDFGIELGFSSDASSDFGGQQPIFRRGSGANSSILARVVDKKQLYTMDHVYVMEENVDQPWAVDSEVSVSSLIQRDSSTCAYQYRSSNIAFPMANYIRVVMLASYKNQFSIQRVFFYYTPLDTAVSSCNHGAPNAAGECQCDTWYTGELCDQPVCQNGGINSNGVCDCADSGFIGTFCQMVVIDDIHTNTIAPPPGASTTTKPATQNTPRPNSATKIGVVLVLLFALFM